MSVKNTVCIQVNAALGIPMRLYCQAHPTSPFMVPNTKYCFTVKELWTVLDNGALFGIMAGLQWKQCSIWTREPLALLAATFL